MHDHNDFHDHVVCEHDFEECCLNCKKSLSILKPHIMDLHEATKIYSDDEATMAAASIEELHHHYHVLDDIAHMDIGDNLAELILHDKEISPLLPSIRGFYKLFFYYHEMDLAKRIIDAVNPWKELKRFSLYLRYEQLVKAQGRESDLKETDIVAFVGTGPVPITLILLHKFFKVRCIGVDIDPEAVAVSQKVIAQLQLDASITILQGDEQRLADMPCNAIMVAALAEPKKQIFQNLRKLIAANTVSVSYRTYTGMRAVLYEPVRKSDLKGFQEIKRILPTRRVNNTVVFIEKVL